MDAADIVPSIHDDIETTQHGRDAHITKHHAVQCAWARLPFSPSPPEGELEPKWLRTHTNHTDTHRHSPTHTDTHRDTHTHTLAEINTHTHTRRNKHKHTDTQTHTHTHIYTDRQTDRQRDRIAI